MAIAIPLTKHTVESLARYRLLALRRPLLQEHLANLLADARVIRVDCLLVVGAAATGALVLGEQSVFRFG
jgi:hypothetical protein